MKVRRAVPSVPLAGLLAVVVAVLLAGCEAGHRDPGRSAPAPAGTASGPPLPSPSLPSPSPSHDRIPVPSRAVAVYYVVDPAAGFRLQREFYRVRTEDAASVAVRVLLASATGLDPDYRSHWPPAAALRSPVTAVDGTIVVDLTGVAGARLGPELARFTVQQLVFTVQDAMGSTDPVRILVDGEPVDALWGTVGTADPVPRGDGYALRSLVQIHSPQHGATVGRHVEVTGQAAVLEGAVRWEVLRDGVVVQSGSTTTTVAQRFAPFGFAVTLEPGEYTIRVLESDPSGGEGRPVLSDDKAITVLE